MGRKECRHGLWHPYQSQQVVDIGQVCHICLNHRTWWLSLPWHIGLHSKDPLIPHFFSPQCLLGNWVPVCGKVGAGGRSRAFHLSGASWWADEGFLKTNNPYSLGYIPSNSRPLGAQCYSCLVRWLSCEELPEYQWWAWTPLCAKSSPTGCSRPRVSLPWGAQSTSSYSPERDYSYWKCFRKVHGSSSYQTWHSPSETSVLQEDSFLPIHSTFNPPGSLVLLGTVTPIHYMLSRATVALQPRDECRDSLHLKRCILRECVNLGSKCPLT